MRLLVLILALLALGTERGGAQWRVEPHRPNLATTVIRELGPDTFYGFTCFRRRWRLFFNHSPPDGGRCEDHHDCEGALRRITVRLVIDGAGEHPADFDLTENTYYGAEEISPGSLAAIAAAPAITLKLDPRLAEAWGIEELNLPMDGLQQVLERARARCAPRRVRRRRGAPRRGSRRDRR